MNISNCIYRDEKLGCVDCSIYPCPCIEEEETNTVPGVFIFKTYPMFNKDRLEELRANLLDQVKSGVVLLPPYVDFICAIPKDCEIKILDKDGNVVEVEKGE